MHADDAYANLVLPPLLTQRRITGRDAAFATELLAGTCRMTGTYDQILVAASGRALGHPAAGRAGPAPARLPPAAEHAGADPRRRRRHRRPGRRHRRGAGDRPGERRAAQGRGAVVRGVDRRPRRRARSRRRVGAAQRPPAVDRGGLRRAAAGRGGRDRPAGQQRLRPGQPGGPPGSRDGRRAARRRSRAGTLEPVRGAAGPGTPPSWPPSATARPGCRTRAPS